MPREPVAAAVAISRSRFVHAESAVLTLADPLFVAAAVPVAAVVGGPLLLAAAHGLPDETTAELDRLGCPRLFALGLDLPDAERVDHHDDHDGRDGRVDRDRDRDDHDRRDRRDGGEGGAAAASVAAAAFVRARAGTVRAFALADGDAGRVVAGPVAAAAALRRFPVMIGPEAARVGALEGERRAAVTYLVGRAAIEGAARVPGGFPLPTPSDDEVPTRLLQLLRADGVQPAAYGVVPKGTDALLAAVLAACGGPLLAEAPSDAETPLHAKTRLDAGADAEPSDAEDPPTQYVLAD